MAKSTAAPYRLARSCAKATRIQRKLEGHVPAAAGGFPITTIVVSDQEEPVSVSSLAEIERLKPRLSSEQLEEAKSELRRRRNWKAADKKLAFSAALALEQKLSEQEEMLARIMWMASPGTLAKVIAKLHSLIAMENPGMKHQAPPWPQLRTIVGDLVHIERQRTN